MKALLEALQPGAKDWDLAQAIDPARLPAHIAIIMDGNGRWAGRRYLPRVAGHKAGIGPVRTAVETCARLGVKALTLYAFSVDNWKRPRAEVEPLWLLLRSGSADSHFRRNAHQQFSALADCVFRTLRDRNALARFHAHGPVAGRLGIPEA